ncbi:hypothetical protein [Mesorhizobium sp.]|nr:hypothetical protein [Mesorhizobium sp.]
MAIPWGDGKKFFIPAIFAHPEIRRQDLDPLRSEGFSKGSHDKRKKD